MENDADTQKTFMVLLMIKSVLSWLLMVVIANVSEYIIVIVVSKVEIVIANDGYQSLAITLVIVNHDSFRKAHNQ